MVRPLPEEPGQAPAQRTAHGGSQDTGSQYQAKVAYSQGEDEWISTLLSLRGGPVWSGPAIHRAGCPSVFPVMEHVQTNGSPDWGPLTRASRTGGRVDDQAPAAHLHARVVGLPCSRVGWSLFQKRDWGSGGGDSVLYLWAKEVTDVEVYISTAGEPCSTVVAPHGGAAVA